MKAVPFSRFGPASQVTELVEVPEPAPPGSGEVLIEVEVAPINPSDLLHFEGRYAQAAPCPPSPARASLAASRGWEPMCIT